MNATGWLPDSPGAIETAVSRFEERFDNALRDAPPSKAWVGAALARRGAPRCPVHLRELSLDVVVRHGDALANLFTEHPDDLVFVEPYDWTIGFQEPGRSVPLDPLRMHATEAEWTDEWGTRWAHATGGVGASPVGFPLEDWSGLDGYLARHMPDPNAPGRLDGALPRLQLHGSARLCVAGTSVGLFERLHCLRGMETTLEGFYETPRETERLLDALSDYHVEMIRAWGRLPAVDALFLGDDWGTQTALMISPAMWRRYFAARYRRLCAVAHESGLLVLFHSCGNVFDIIGDLIDAGVDVIDPLQPEAMDLAAVAREYGGNVAFCGGISDQRLGTQTPAQVRDEVRRLIDTLGTPFGNALILAPANSLMPETPLENLVALFEACHGQ